MPADAGLRSDLPSTRRKRRKVPAHGFLKGAAAGLVVVIPVSALTVWAAAKIGLLDHDAGVIACLRMALVFAGVAAVLTAGGVGRLAAHASVDGGGGGKVRAMIAGARAMAAGGAAITLIAAIPHGGLPASPAGWIALLGAGAMTGAVSGVVIGVACSGEMPTLQELGVWPPTEWWPFDEDEKKPPEKTAEDKPDKPDEPKEAAP